MKTQIFLVFLLFIYSYAQNNITCSDIYYGREGEECVPGNSKRQCKQFLICNNNYCREGFPSSSCVKDTDCIFGSPLEEGVKCVKGLCLKRRYAGFTCSQNEECYTEECKGGICTGKKLGESCNPLLPITCEKEHYCSFKDKVCKPQKKENEDCADYEPLEERLIPAGSNYMIICPGGTKCTRTLNSTQTPICKRIYYAKEGEACTSIDDCYLQHSCVGGICKKDQIFKPCGASNCTENEECLCNNNGPPSCKAVSNKCSLSDTLRRWTDCWSDNNCKWQRNPYNTMLTEVFLKETCMGQLCSDIAKEYFCCLFNGWDFTHYSKAYSTPLGCASSGWVIAFVVILLAAFVLVTFAGFVGIGYYMWKHTYVTGHHNQSNTSFEKIVE